jgi:hypothetical protein
MGKVAEATKKLLFLYTNLCLLLLYVGIFYGIMTIFFSVASFIANKTTNTHIYTPDDTISDDMCIAPPYCVTSYTTSTALAVVFGIVGAILLYLSMWFKNELSKLNKE